uniref:Transmembrane and coiled-coil domains 3 n=1 Tax=Pavo cristatus TaxID=9049 RepID=A0A8C9FJL5_PAVCR
LFFKKKHKLIPCEMTKHSLGNTAEHEDVVKHAIKLHRGKGAVITQRKQWVMESCRKLSGLLRQKNVVLNKLKSAIRAVEKDAGLSDEEKLFQVHTFEIFQKELNESENSVFQAIHGLQRALQGDYKDVVNMKESSRQRLEALREAAIKEEMEYVELLAAEKHQVEALKNMQHQNKSLSMLDEILEDVRKAADRLEEEIEEHAFDDNKSVSKNNCLLRISEQESLFSLFMLTICFISRLLHTDIYFIFLKSIVQVETLGEFGVFFTLFLVGLEFSPERLRKVWKISLQGPCYMTVLMIAFGLLWGHLLQIRPTQSVFISTCLSLSSTPLVSRFLAGTVRGDKEGKCDLNTDCRIAVSTFSSAFRKRRQILVLYVSFGSAIYECRIKIYCFGIWKHYILFCLLVCSNKHKTLLFQTWLRCESECLAKVVGFKRSTEIIALFFFFLLGLHVFPTFVIYELTVLLFLTLSVVIMKFVLAVLVLSLILPKTSQYIKWIVSAGLAQVSEFSFVLGSRARRAGIISREVYLLILSVTTLSLLLAPALWRAAIMKCVPRPERRSST